MNDTRPSAMKLIVTIDTEEDNWRPYAPPYTAENIARLPRLHELFVEYGVRPTYLVTYQVVTNDRAAATLAQLAASGTCEIGAHCHPWSTPPFSEARELRNSMLCNLPDALQEEKIQVLHDAIVGHLGLRPTSFRSGRWGFSPAVANALQGLDYEVDSSITAYTDWRQCQGPDYRWVSPMPFRFSPHSLYRPCARGSLLQVPATVGFLQNGFRVRNALANGIARTPLRRLRLLGILDRLHLLNKVWLSPENASGAQMIALARSMERNRYSVLNMFFHSSTLTAGLTPFVRSREDERRFIASIEQFLRFARASAFESITLSEAKRAYPLPQATPNAAAYA